MWFRSTSGTLIQKSQIAYIQVYRDSYSEEWRLAACWHGTVPSAPQNVILVSMRTEAGIRRAEDFLFGRYMHGMTSGSMCDFRALFGDDPDFIEPTL